MHQKIVNSFIFSLIRLGPLEVEQKKRNVGKRAKLEKNKEDERKPQELREDDIIRAENETTKNVIAVSILPVICIPATHLSSLQDSNSTRGNGRGSKLVQICGKSTRFRSISGEHILSVLLDTRRRVCFRDSGKRRTYDVYVHSSTFKRLMLILCGSQSYAKLQEIRTTSKAWESSKWSCLSIWRLGRYIHALLPTWELLTFANSAQLKCLIFRNLSFRNGQNSRHKWVMAGSGCFEHTLTTLSPLWIVPCPCSLPLHISYFILFIHQFMSTKEALCLCLGESLVILNEWYTFERQLRGWSLWHEWSPTVLVFENDPRKSPIETSCCYYPNSQVVLSRLLEIILRSCYTW